MLFDIASIDKNNQKIHIIGNPPFGRQSSIAFKFIDKSCSFADSVSFILPRSFKKQSMQSKIPLKFHLVDEIDLPENSFIVNNEKYDVPCVFQIWVKKNEMRNKPEKLIPHGFEFVAKPEIKADEMKTINDKIIAFRRVGVNAGMIKTSVGDIQSASIQSHYFIRFTNNKPFDENLEKIMGANFAGNNTVGAKSISKQEIIAGYNNVLSD
jgi:hypothetical protein